MSRSICSVASPVVRPACLAAALLLAACGGGSGGGLVGDGGGGETPPRWKPQVSDTWQWQLSDPVNTAYAVNVYDVDLFDTPVATLNLLKAQGKRVVCYFSAGSAENWRTDYTRFTSVDMGKPLDGWAGERWLDTRSANVRAVMKERLALAAARGCDGVEPDNVDAYTNDSGLPLTSATQLDYNRFLAREAHALGMAVGLKNDVDQLVALASAFDFAVNEQCHEYDECGGYAVFTSAGKPVFNAEYHGPALDTPGERELLCQKARAAGLRTLVLPLALDDSLRFSCD